MKIAFLSKQFAFGSAATHALESLGIEVLRHREVGALISSLKQVDFDAVVLEDVDQELLNWLAMLQIYSVDQLPIVVTGFGGAVAISRAILHGAHDYASINEGPHTLVARVQAQVLIRQHRKQAFTMAVGGYVLEADTQVLRQGSQIINLTGREFALAWALFENAGRVVTLNALSMQVWGKSSDISKRTIEQHVYKLRRKLGSDEDSATGIRIQTVYGVGYRLCERSANAHPAGGVEKLSFSI